MTANGNYSVSKGLIIFTTALLLMGGFIYLKQTSYGSDNGLGLKEEEIRSFQPLATDRSSTPYKIGAGIADITGSAAEWGMMGYAMIQQVTKGLHFRLRSRAFIMQENAEDGKRVVFVSADLCMIQPTVKDLVIDALKAKYGDLYDHDNVILSATHTHAGPAGYSQLVLYDVTSLGYSADNQKVVVDGIIRSIVNAHDSIRNGRIKIAQGTLDNSNINRSPYSYNFNPEVESYPYNTDHDFTLLKFEDEDGTPMGTLNWFAVHGTSMNNTNGLISGDNKGRASQLFEELMNDPETLPGNGPFVAAFGQTNSGDVSPNTAGVFCINDGSPCDDVHSLCQGQKGFCQGKGPGETDMESNDIIGRNQFEKALELWQVADREISGPIDYRLKWQSMSSIKVSPEFSSTGKEEKTCVAALGEGFAGGTTDGPGDFPFQQGETSVNAFFRVVSGWLSKPTPEQEACQAPKSILLNVGTNLWPIQGRQWVVDVAPLQIAKIGDLVIIAAPGEYTTMSGRRLRKTVYDALKAQGAVNENTVVVIAALSNTYTHYITTFEEFEHQRYEGGSTLYGPHTLAAYQQEFAAIATALAKGEEVKSTSEKEKYTMTLSLHPGVIDDTVPVGHHFGDVKEPPKAAYTVGKDKVVVEFWGAHPNNDYKTEGTFLTVELRTGDSWKVIATDSNWETIFRWKRHGVSASIVTIEWDIPASAVPGEYRIQYFGDHKNLLKKVTPFVGTSPTFTVIGRDTTPEVRESLRKKKGE